MSEEQNTNQKTKFNRPPKEVVDKLNSIKKEMEAKRKASFIASMICVDESGFYIPATSIGKIGANVESTDLDEEKELIFDLDHSGEGIKIKIPIAAFKRALEHYDRLSSVDIPTSLLGLTKGNHFIDSGLLAVIAPPSGGKTIYLNAIFENAILTGLNEHIVITKLIVGEPDTFAFITRDEIETAISVALSESKSNVIIIDSLRFASYLGKQKLLKNGISKNVFEVTTALDVVARRLGKLIIAAVTVEDPNDTPVYFERLRGSCSGVIEIDLNENYLISSLRGRDRNVTYSEANIIREYAKRNNFTYRYSPYLGKDQVIEDKRSEKEEISDAKIEEIDIEKLKNIIRG